MPPNPKIFRAFKSSYDRTDRSRCSRSIGYCHGGGQPNEIQQITFGVAHAHTDTGSQSDAWAKSIATRDEASDAKPESGESVPANEDDDADPADATNADSDSAKINVGAKNCIGSDAVKTERHARADPGKTNATDFVPVANVQNNPDTNSIATDFLSTAGSTAKTGTDIDPDQTGVSTAVTPAKVDSSADSSEAYAYTRASSGC